MTVPNPSSLIFAKNDKPNGITYENWTILWWKWLLSIPRSENPAMDQTGVNADLNQPGNKVFFLCQTIEGVQPIPCRTITIPLGTSLFLPIINWISIEGENGNTEEELTIVAKKRMDIVSNLQFSINDYQIPIDLRNYRITSSSFYAYFPPDNIFHVCPGDRRLVSDGYWIFLKPLVSDSLIKSYGSCSKGLTRIGISYRIKLLQDSGMVTHM